MKVFVYTREIKPKKIAVITDVSDVTENKAMHRIVVETSNGVQMEFDTRRVKTTIYQYW